MERLALPAGGGQLALGADHALVAEALGCEEAYLVRAAPTRRRAAIAALVLSLSCSGRDGRGRARRQAGSDCGCATAEILTLLCANPDGLTSEQLSAGVYGDAGQAGSIRVEISRLRKLLGDCIESERYRLQRGGRSDVAPVCGLLHRGEVREAAARYAGPLLPRSGAPGVVPSARRWSAGCASR